MLVLNNNQFIADVAYDIIEQTAPGELPLFQAISTQYFKKPASIFKKQANRDEPLGFGLIEAVSLLTPAVLVVVTQTITLLKAEVGKYVVEKSASVIDERVKAMFKVFHKGEAAHKRPSIPLTNEQLAYVRQQAYEKFLQLKLSDILANRLADAVVASLVVASPRRGE